jgi:hypothetical protein
LVDLELSNWNMLKVIITTIVIDLHIVSSIESSRCLLPKDLTGKFGGKRKKREDSSRRQEAKEGEVELE